MVPKKRESKRKSTRLRTKIDRKVREHHRKVRKDSKKTTKWKSKRDPGVPNSLPFKEQLLTELRTNKQKERTKKLTDTEQYAQLLCSAAERDDQYEDSEGESEEDQSTIKENSKKTFYKEFQKVLEAADVIVQVLDARDPLGCREAAVEQLVQEKDKKLVLLLNKIDLVPRENAENWVSYLRREYPTIPFKASTQLQRHNLGQSSRDSPEPGTAKNCCYGAEEVMNILKNYCRSQDIKTSITVGVVGMPNVGKSSFINSLKRSRVCQVGAMPGMTRVIQEIVLDRNIKLLDSPGIVFSSSSDAALRNVIKVEQIEDLQAVVACIMQKTNSHVLAQIYGIQSEFASNDVVAFLTLVATSHGKLKQGGILDLDCAARMVINDWNAAKIPFYSLPPATKSDIVESCIVDSLAVPFQLVDSAEMEIE